MSPTASLALLIALLASTGEAVEKPCGPAAPRHSRSEPLVFPQRDLVPCHSDRTIVEDAAFFSGEFRSDTGRLTTRFLGDDKVGYTAVLAGPGCAAKVEGTAVVRGDRLTAMDGATRLAFADGGVDLTLGRGACAGRTEELFYDHGGTVLAEPNDEGSGCDLSVPGVDKEAFIRFYYAFKRAVAKGDRKAVAGMVQYPLTVRGARGEIRLRTPAGLVARYPRVFTRCVREAILKQRISRIFCRDQGVMFGNGEVWVAVPYTENPRGGETPKIIAINGC